MWIPEGGKACRAGGRGQGLTLGPPRWLLQAASTDHRPQDDRLPQNVCTAQASSFSLTANPTPEASQGTSCPQWGSPVPAAALPAAPDAHSAADHIPLVLSTGPGGRSVHFVSV